MTHEEKVEKLLLIIARSQIIQAAECLTHLDNGPERERVINVLVKDEQLIADLSD